MAPSLSRMAYHFAITRPCSMVVVHSGPVISTHLAWSFTEDMPKNMSIGRPGYSTTCKGRCFSVGCGITKDFKDAGR